MYQSAKVAALTIPNSTVDPAPLLATAQKAADTVRRVAQRRGTRLKIQVTQSGNTIRVSLAGRNADEYKGLLHSEISRLMVDTKDEIKKSIVSRISR